MDHFYDRIRYYNWKGEAMKNFINNEWSHLEKKLIISTFFLLGVVIGFGFSPIKKGIYCGNNNGDMKYLKKEESD